MKAAKKISLSDLSPADREALAKELEQQQREENEKKRAARETYKALVGETVYKVFPILQAASIAIATAKKKAFEEFQTLMALKTELYNRSSDNFSHTFTTADGNISITVGHRIVDRWDDTVNVGIGKVNDFLKGLAEDSSEDTQKLVNTIQRLLSRDAQGNLNASRVMELKKTARDFSSPLLDEAIEIIEESYRPHRTKQFISCKYRDEKGVDIILPLSVTEAEITI